MGDAAVPGNYIPILIFIGVGIALGTLTLLLGKFVRPNQPYRAKLAPYESGSPLFRTPAYSFRFGTTSSRCSSSFLISRSSSCFPGPLHSTVSGWLD